MERAIGIEPTSEAWEDAVEPGSFMPQLEDKTRVSERIQPSHGGAAHKPATRQLTVPEIASTVSRARRWFADHRVRLYARDQRRRKTCCSAAGRRRMGSSGRQLDGKEKRLRSGVF
jgi:hypothetical protein